MKLVLISVDKPANNAAIRVDREGCEKPIHWRYQDQQGWTAVADDTFVVNRPNIPIRVVFGDPEGFHEPIANAVFLGAPASQFYLLGSKLVIPGS